MRTSITKIVEHKIVGNAMSDDVLMSLIHDFVTDDANSIEDRCQALDKLDEVMGVGCEPATEQDVYQYIYEQSEE